MEHQVFHRLVEGKLTALPPPTWVFRSPDLHQLSVFWVVAWHKSQICPTALFILSPPPLCTMQGKAQCNIQEISRPCPCPVILQERHRGWKRRKKEKPEMPLMLLICSEQRGAAVPVVSQLTVVSPQTGRTNVTLQKRDKRDHPKGICIKWLS